MLRMGGSYRGENEHGKLPIEGVSDGDVESRLIDWRPVRTAYINRIEVLRGPESSLYGHAVMGGAIPVFTRGETAGSRVDYAVPVISDHAPNNTNRFEHAHRSVS
jgi:outer membrane receptor for ferrienterochelin and colicin